MYSTLQHGHYNNLDWPSPRFSRPEPRTVSRFREQLQTQHCRPSGVACSTGRSCVFLPKLPSPQSNPSLHSLSQTPKKGQKATLPHRAKTVKRGFRPKKAMLRLLTSFAAAGVVLPAAEAILVAPDSPCSTNCGNVLDSTAPDDLVCTPGQYTGGYNNNAGTVFQGCVQCELNSGYVTKNNYSDNEAALCMCFISLKPCVLLRKEF